MNTLTDTKSNVKVRIVGLTDGRFETHERGEVQSGGAQAYPFLRQFERWEIVTRSVLAPELDGDTPYPALRMVREGKVVDVNIPTMRRRKLLGDLPGLHGDCFMFGMPTDKFLETVGVRVSMVRGAAVVSKRLARLFSPYRFWSFYGADEVQIAYSDSLDDRLWDGCGLMSRAFLQRCTPHMLANVIDSDSHEGYRRSLESAQRIEITLMTADGQLKGDVLVVDNMPDAHVDADFLFPRGAEKSEVRFMHGTFVGFKAIRRAKTHMRIDIQSLINLHGFIKGEHMLRWLEDDSARFIANIENGETDEILGRLLNADSAEKLANLRGWFLGDYFISGGKAMWFGGIVQALSRQRLKLLDMQVNGKYRFPIPGGRFYIMPAAVGGCDVADGHVKLDTKRATAFVSDADWLNYIVSVLGGCDGDDAVWVLPFTDMVDSVCATTGEVVHDRKLLLWRSPNQDGEYVLLRPTADSDDLGTDWPLLDSSKLSPRIDTVSEIVYGQLPLPELADRSAELRTLRVPALRKEAKRHGLRRYAKLRKAKLVTLLLEVESHYAVSKMTPAIEQAVKNLGVLGMYCNVLMVCRATFGRIPRTLPARLEDVIDGSVKDSRDLSNVRSWCQKAAQQLARQRKPISAELQPRIAGLTKLALTTAPTHWLDSLMDGARQHLIDVQSQLDALTLHTCPPKLLFDVGTLWQEQSLAVYRAYSDILGQSASKQAVNGSTYRNAAKVTEQALAQWPEHQAELFAGMTSLVYMGGLSRSCSDNVLWQTNPHSDTSDIGARFVAALRQFGVLGEPIWTEAGAVQYWEDSTAASEAIPLTINGVWWNYAKCYQQRYAAMNAVPKHEVKRFKQRLATVAPKLVGSHLTVKSADNRLQIFTEHGNLFGCVRKGQEPLLLGKSKVAIEHLTVTHDGNVNALVVAAM